MNRDEKWLLEEKYGGEESAAFSADRQRLASGEPLGYVIGWTPFFGLRIHLDSRPLIPRPETEWWTEQLFNEIERKAAGREVAVLDLCAGSGAIGCAVLAHAPEARVSFGELRPEHEATIHKNLAENRLDASRAEVCIGDLFAPFAGRRFDFIAANPPYIPSGRALPESVATHEPAEALYAGEDGLALIRRIAAALPAYLTHHGQAWIECDSAHAEAARDLFATHGFEVQIHEDQYGVPRFIKAGLLTPSRTV